jgi:hypothetical protein
VFPLNVGGCPLILRLVARRVAVEFFGDRHKTRVHRIAPDGERTVCGKSVEGMATARTSVRVRFVPPQPTCNACLLSPPIRP